MAAPYKRTETPDLDTIAEIKQLCKSHSVTRRRFYEATHLSAHLSMAQFYAALRGDPCVPETETALDLSLLTFRDWVASKSAGQELNDPNRLLALLHADYLVMGKRLRVLAAALGMTLKGRPTYDDD